MLIELSRSCINEGSTLNDPDLKNALLEVVKIWKKFQRNYIAMIKIPLLK